MDTFEQIPAAGLCRIHMDPEQPVPGPRPPRADRASCPTRRSTPSSAPPGRRRARRCCSPSCASWAARSGGRPRTAARSRKLDADFVMFGIGLPMTPELGEAIDGPPRRARARDGALGAPRAATSTSPSARATSTRSCPRSTCARLAEVKRRWDPDGHDPRQPRCRRDGDLTTPSRGAGRRTACVAAPDPKYCR